MKTALIIGAGAVGLYLFWSFAVNAASASAAVAAAGTTGLTPLGQFSAVPQAPAGNTTQTVAYALSNGIIASSAPVPGVMAGTAAAAAYRASGYVVIGTGVYPPGPNAAAAVSSSNGAAVPGTVAGAPPASDAIGPGLVPAAPPVTVSISESRTGRGHF